MNKILALLQKIVFLNVKLSKLFDRIFPDFIKTKSYEDQLLSFVNKTINGQEGYSILEVGGIDRPLLQRSSKVRYDGIDIEYKAQCEEIYDHFYVQSIEQPIENKYDMVISITLLEHVQNNDASVTQMYQALKHGGHMAHYLPSKYHPYSLILRLVSPKWQVRLIKTLRPWAMDLTGYPAFFNKCSPKEMKILFASTGFRNIKIVPFFRATDYFRFFFPCYIVIALWDKFCNRLKLEQLCSGFICTVKIH
jgi:SAM-dependent methyltransferase